jgi:hypothetical protein
MTHALNSLIGLSAASLLLASGCASSQPRAHTDAPAEQSQQSTNSNSPSELASPNATDHNSEFVIGTVFADESVPQYRVPITEYTLSEIQEELEAMYDLDRELVSETFGTESQKVSAVSTIRAIDRSHSDRLKEIVNHIGWPTRDLVGLKATQAAYMVIQHAGHDNEFQNKCLALMVDMVEEGQLPASYVALLTDRIRVFQDLPQVFGTQMAMSSDAHGIMVPTPTVPIEDPEHLDDRRKLMGMPPHAEFVGAISIAYEASKTDPGKAFAEVSTDE